MKYRPDIDGLRTLAVVPVVLFHANFLLFSGGYVGVDIFFVISGYLITSILHRELLDRRMSIIRFYERRIRRIFPALFAMLAVTLLFAAFVLMPDDLRAFGKYLVAATLFSANILFWRETDYFAAPAESNPLLHTWSLAVEEQYYIFFPLLLALLFRFARRWLVAALSVIAAASLAVSVWATDNEPTGAFYLLPSRAWELLLGSLLAVGAVPALRHRIANEAVAWIGMALIVVAIFAYDADTPFPGFAALLPCLGAAALIHTGTARTIPARLLSLKPVVGIGLVSYSFYLWHWPLIVLAQYNLMRDLAGWERWAVTLVSLLLAILSWHFIERPFRAPGQWRLPRRLFPAAAAAMSATIGIGIGLFLLDGLPQRVPELAAIKAAQAAQGESDKPLCFLQTQSSYRDWNRVGCLLVENGADRVLLWGDSHANQYASGLRAAAAELPVTLLLYSSAGCAPVFDGAFPTRPNCRANNEHVIELIRSERITAVMLAGVWDNHLSAGNFTLADLNRTITRLQELVPTVIVLGQPPLHSYRNPIQVSLRRAKAGDTAPEYYLAPVGGRTFNDSFSSKLTGTVFIDPWQVLCRGEECLYMLGDKLLYQDNNHLSGFGGRYVVERLIAPQLRDVLDQARRTSYGEPAPLAP